MDKDEDLKEYEDQAASLNPGDNWRKSITHKNEGDSAGSSKESFPEKADATDKAGSKTRNQDLVRQQESEPPSQINFTGSGSKNEGKLSGGRGPLFAVFGGLSVSIIVIGMIGNMFSSVLVNMKESLFNDAQSNSSRTNKVYFGAAFAKKFTKGVCGEKVAILCKFETLSKRQITKMERAGFKLDTVDSKIPGRYNLNSGTFPDGSKFSSAREFNQLANSSPDRAKVVRYATLGKTSYFLNKKFEKILGKFGTDKSKKLTGKTKQENDDDLNKNTNGVEKSEGKNPQQIRDEAAEKTKEEISNETRNKISADTAKRLAGKGGYLAIPVIIGCGAYNMSHFVTAYAKKYHIDQMVKYAMVFLNTADRIKAEGDLSPEIASYVGDLLTQADPRETITDPEGNEIENPDYSKTATDAQAYEIAAHGDQTNLTPSAENFKAAGYTGKDNTSWLGSLSNMTKAFEISAAPFDVANGNIVNTGWKLVQLGTKIATNFATGGDTDVSQELRQFANGNAQDITSGQKTIRWSCIKGEKGAVAAYIVACAASGAEAFTGILTAPAILQLGGCAAALLCEGNRFVGADVCRQLTDWASKKAFDMADELGITDWLLSYVKSTVVGSFTQYTDVGNAFGAGEAFLGEKTANGYGLRPAKDTKEIKNFIASTNKDIAIENQIAIENAKATPFDATNPYSFLGTVLRSAQLYYDARTPVFSGLASLFRMVPASLAAGDTAMAYYNQPVQTPTARYDCDDSDLLAIGVMNADKFCNTVGITRGEELDQARQQADDANYSFIEENIKYMTSENGGVAVQEENNEGFGGTLDDSFCDIPGGDFLSGGVVSVVSGDGTCKKVKEDSVKPSIDENGNPIDGSQYSKYINYCTEERQWPWGTFGEPIQEAKSTRDIDWFSGRQCLSDSKMMQNFRTYYNMCTQLATMDDTTSCYEETAATTGSGDVCSLLNNPNIVLINPETKKGVEEICKTGHATNLCGKDFTLNPILIQTMTQLSSKYKVWVNNFGFKGDRNNPSDCTSDTYQHPKGNAVDLNGVEIINGGGKAGGEGSWGGITFSASQVPTVQAYANDWMSAMPPTRGGVGQQGCGNFNVSFPATAQLVNGSAFFGDSCDHLHIDVRERSNLRAV